MEEATALFRERGFASTSMQDISDAVGLLKGSLYYYIQSKEELLFRILSGLHTDGEEIIASIQFDSPDPLRELNIYLKSAAIFAATNADRLAIFLRDFHNIAEDKQREIIRERAMYSEAVRALVAEAKVKGLTPPDLDVALAATLISSAVASTHEWFRPGGARPLQQAAGEIATLLTNSIRRQAQSASPLAGGAEPSRP